MNTTRILGQSNLKGSLMKRKRLLKVATATAAFAVLVTTVYAQEKADKPVATNQTIAVEHIRIESAKSFADVRAALERTVPNLDPSLVNKHCQPSLQASLGHHPAVDEGERHQRVSVTLARWEGRSGSNPRARARSSARR